MWFALHLSNTTLGYTYPNFHPIFHPQKAGIPQLFSHGTQGSTPPTVTYSIPKKVTKKQNCQGGKIFHGIFFLSDSKCVSKGFFFELLNHVLSYIIFHGENLNLSFLLAEVFSMGSTTPPFCPWCTNKSTTFFHWKPSLCWARNSDTSPRWRAWKKRRC